MKPKLGISHPLKHTRPKPRLESLKYIINSIEVSTPPKKKKPPRFARSFPRHFVFILYMLIFCYLCVYILHVIFCSFIRFSID